jgi:hypothetical protein
MLIGEPQVLACPRFDPAGAYNSCQWLQAGHSGQLLKGRWDEFEGGFG